MQRAGQLIASLLFLCNTSTAQHQHDTASEGGMSDPAKHSFADPSKGRDGYALAGDAVNEFRVYDFYQRQADHFMKMKPTKFLPAYPGLDAGQHGHWGKFNQNSHSDERWNQQTGSTLLGACLHVDKLKVQKGINLLLGNKGQTGACFDAWTLTYRYVWSGGFVKYDGYRWGTSRGVKMEGEKMLSHNGVWRGDNNPDERLSDAVFHGIYRHGKHNAISYRIGGLEVLDAPWAVTSDGTSVMTRRLSLNSTGNDDHRLPLFQLPAEAKQLPSDKRSKSVTAFHAGDECWLVALQSSPTASVTNVDGSLFLKTAGSIDETVSVALWHGDVAKKDAAIKAMSVVPSDLPAMGDFSRGGPAQWNDAVTMPGQVSDQDKAYVVDTLPVPFDNPYNSVMMLCGIDFLPNGDALVATLPGDVWKVSGINDDLKEVTWKRFAAGLHQPFGIKIDGDDIFVLCKDRMQILRDLNDDGEADFYENYDNSWVEGHGHTHVFGTDRDREGNFYFPAFDKFYKLPPDGSGVKLFAQGFRNCMGVAVSDDGLVLAAPQEGTWTPASMIIDVREGEHYGFQRTSEPISPPMCFIPRGVDNSTGGMVFVDSDRWANH